MTPATFDQIEPKALLRRTALAQFAREEDIPSHLGLSEGLFLYIHRITADAKHSNRAVERLLHQEVALTADDIREQIAKAIEETKH